jgi:hypothetical protein
MQELRFVAVSEDGSYAVLAVPGRSGRYILPIDERLRAVAQGQTTRLAQYEIEVESPLRPKEIQARIRAGETAEEIADAAGIPVERVRWFEGPVLAERAYIADQAQAASVRRAGDSGGPGPRLGDIVPERLSASGADPEDGQWDSRKRGDGHWQVTLTFPAGGRLHVAEWVFDSRRRHVMPDDDNAARLSLPESELPPEPVSLPGEATVTPLAPRLGAAAGMGGGGFAGGGSGVGVRSFRPERSVIPDRSLGGDRSLADRPVMPERPAMSHGATSAPPRSAGHDYAGFREQGAVSESAAYRPPTPAPAPAQASAPGPTPEREQRAPEQPAPAGVVPVTAPSYVFEDSPSSPSSPAGPAAAAPGGEWTRERTEHTAARHVVFEDPEPAFREEQPELPAAPAPAPSPQTVQTAAQAERVRQPEMDAREPEVSTAPAAAAPAPTPAAPPAPIPPTSSAAPGTSAQTPSQDEAAPAASSAPAEPGSAPTAAPVASEPAAARATIPAQPEPAAAEPAPELVSTRDPEPVAASTARPAATQAAQAAVAAAPTAADAAAAEPSGAPPEPAEDQSARQRAGSKKSAKGRRSSVPSWDEIMLGSSRQRD